MDLKIKIRKAQLSDLSQIRQLFFDTITKVNVKDYTPEQIKVWSSGVGNIERWEKKFSEQLFIVATDNETLLGFTSLLQNYYIDHLYVSHLHMGKGIASQLIDYIENIALQSSVLKLRSDVSITALPFFEKRGYIIVKRNENLHKGEVLINFDVVKKLVK